MTRPTRVELEAATCALAALAQMSPDEGLADELSVLAFALLPDAVDSAWFQVGRREWEVMLRSRFEARGAASA